MNSKQHSLNPTLQLACDLIERPSITPHDKGCQTLMRERLSALGFDITTLNFGEGETLVENFWASLGDASTGPTIAFAGHTDVVPTGPLEQWHSAPFVPEIRDGMLYGRGAADMKASLAAMITCCEAFVAKHSDHFKGQIAFLITSDEEGPAINGTVKVVDWLRANKIALDYCIVGEPSSQTQLGDMIKNGRRGSLGGRLIIKGKQGHIAYPHLAANPIHLAAPAINALCNAQWDQGNEYFPPTSFQFSNIQAGTGASNVIPGHIDALFNFRYSTETTAEQLQQGVAAILKQYDLNYELEWTHSGKPFLTEKGALLDALVNSIKQVTNLEPEVSTSGGTSDGRFIAQLDTQVVECGPSNASIHQINESVNVADLEKLQCIYLNTLEQLLTS